VTQPATRDASCSSDARASREPLASVATPGIPMSVEIRQIDPFTHRDAVFRVYCDSLGLDPCSAASLDWRDTVLPRHATRADFDFRAAVDRDGGIVGFVYGYTGAYGQWWTDRVAAEMSEEARSVWLDPPHFEVVQLHVLPSMQRTGIGTRLLDTLLDHQPNDRALLSMDLQSTTAAGTRSWKHVTRGCVISNNAPPMRYRSPTQTSSSGMPSTVKFSPTLPGVRSSRPRKRTNARRRTSRKH
jgi:ribosomal protein S18 acetylase RimI-like enzyme